MSEWSHLPNADHIDRVLESVTSYPDVWAAALYSDLDAAWDEIRAAARDAASSWDVISNAFWYTSRPTVWSASSHVTMGSARFAARDGALALIAYDDSTKYLDMPSEKLRMWAILSEDPAAILLLPAVIAFEKINELECV